MSFSQGVRTELWLGRLAFKGATESRVTEQEALNRQSSSPVLLQEESAEEMCKDWETTNVLEKREAVAELM